MYGSSKEWMLNNKWMINNEIDRWRGVWWVVQVRLRQEKKKHRTEKNWGGVNRGRKKRERKVRGRRKDKNHNSTTVIKGGGREGKKLRSRRKEGERKRCAGHLSWQLRRKLSSSTTRPSVLPPPYTNTSITRLYLRRLSAVSLFFCVFTNFVQLWEVLWCAVESVLPSGVYVSAVRGLTTAVYGYPTH